MAGQHTPGPWQAQPGYHGDERIYISAGERSGLVAQVNPYRAEDEQKANAALIAAAPDLLIQLTGLLAFARFVIKAVDIDTEVTTVRLLSKGELVAEVPLAVALANAEAAIAKAEGR